MSLREKKSFFGKLSERLSDVINARSVVDEELFDELEEILITSDIGMDTTMRIIEELRGRVKDAHITKPEVVKIMLKKIIVRFIDKEDRQKLSNETPLVILGIGVNGGGKTTTIGKIATKLKNEGKSVMLAAADTFRLQSKKNLMNELEKMNKVISREFPEAARETLLVLDATTGKNAISQAKEFGEVTDITGIVITKLDGTAKGGIAITIADEFDMPIKFIGVGEGMDDLKEFDPEDFAGGIFDE